MMEIPKDREVWLKDWRLGKVENLYGTFDCDKDGCVCEFVTLADFVIHSVSGKHGRLGDRFSDEHRRKFKYFTRQGRLKHDIYRNQSEEAEQQESSVQETLK